MNPHAVNDDRSHLAVENLVWCGQFFFERSRDCDQLESRPRFIDVADGVVLQLLRGDLAGQVGVERGTVGQRQNFASARVLHDDGPTDGVGLLYRGVQLALGDVLDLLIDG